MSTRARRFVWIGLSSLACAGAATSIARHVLSPPVTVPIERDVVAAARSARPAPGTAAPSAAPDEGGFSGYGVVEPSGGERKIAAPVSGLVAKVSVSAGSRVKAGDVLVELDASVERAAVLTAEAELASERARLAKALRGLRTEERDAARAEADAARSRRELARAELDRGTRLAETGALATSERERLAQNATASDAAARAAEARLRAAEAGGEPEEVVFARTRVAVAEGRLAQAKAARERLVVRAPADGDVLQVKTHEGEVYDVASRAPLLVFGDLRTLRVRMDVDERDSGRIVLGAKAVVTTAARVDLRIPGRVVEIGRRFGRQNVRTDDPVQRNDTKILEALLELEGSPELLSGQRVTCRITP